MGDFRSSEYYFLWQCLLSLILKKKRYNIKNIFYINLNTFSPLSNRWWKEIFYFFKKFDYEVGIFHMPDFLCLPLCYLCTVFMFELRQSLAYSCHWTVHADILLMWDRYIVIMNTRIGEMNRDDCVHYIYIFIIVSFTCFCGDSLLRNWSLLFFGVLFSFFFCHFQFAVLAVLIPLSLIVSSLQNLLLIHFAYEFRAFSHFLLWYITVQLFRRFLIILISRFLNFD